MYEILVAGGGFAGVWSAAAAVRTARLAGIADGELSVTLVSDGDDLVIRPRLYEADPESKRLPLKGILGPIGVEVVAATVTDIDPAARIARTVDAAGGTGVLRYDRLVLATGSRVIRPSFPGADLVHDIDTMGAAAALEAHLHRLPGAPEPGRFTAVVIGAGFTGLEIATELVDRLRAIAAPHGLADTVRVVLVDRGETIGSGYAPDARAVIADALAALGVTQRLGVSATAVARRASSCPTARGSPPARWCGRRVCGPATSRRTSRTGATASVGSRSTNSCGCRMLRACTPPVIPGRPRPRRVTR